MKTNYRHCERSEAIQLKPFALTTAPKFLIGLLRRSLRSFLAMTGFLIIITTPADACMSWLATWRNLPNGTSLPNFSWSHGTNTWAVTANFGSGNQTIRGESRLTGVLCECRMTEMEGHDIWSRSFSSARGSGTENCSGNRSVSCVGPWAFLTGLSHWTAPDCAAWCVTCLHISQPLFSECTRAAVLQ